MKVSTFQYETDRSPPNSHPKKSMLGPTYLGWDLLTWVGTCLEWPPPPSKHKTLGALIKKISNVVIIFVHLVKLWELWYVNFGNIPVLYWCIGCNLGIWYPYWTTTYQLGMTWGNINLIPIPDLNQATISLGPNNTSRSPLCLRKLWNCFVEWCFLNLL